MSDEQRTLYEAILGGKRGPGMRGEDGTLIRPFNAMLLNPHFKVHGNIAFYFRLRRWKPGVDGLYLP